VHDLEQNRARIAELWINVDTSARSSDGTLTITSSFRYAMKT
jgi:hypothetical protein